MVVFGSVGLEGEALTALQSLESCAGMTDDVWFDRSLTKDDSGVLR